ncbi:MAG: hypothetical protein OXL37_17120 [Chloroflexota bacterium]|nr:hypothetical protein [Chloroflexota bacterium]MDE2960431.1 hypothetical protein [Chloroflexota bacterium]
MSPTALTTGEQEYDAKAILVAEGDWDNDLMEQVKPPGPIR